MCIVPDINPALAAWSVDIWSLSLPKGSFYDNLNVNLWELELNASVSHDGLSFCDLAWTIHLLPRKHTQTTIWHARPFASTF